MSSRALNETPWDKRKTEKRDLDEEMGGGAYRIHHLPFSSPPVESEMPLYRWLFCVSVSKSLSSISLIREERMRVGQNWGGVTWEATNCFDAIGPCLLCLFCTHTPTPRVDAKFESAIYLVVGANGSSEGSHLHFYCFNDIIWIM